MTMTSNYNQTTSALTDKIDNEIEKETTIAKKMQIHLKVTMTYMYVCMYDHM